MSSVDDSVDLVNHFRAEASTFKRQALTWLGLGSAGGIATLLSLCANLKHPDIALNAFLPSFIAFVVSIVLAGFVVFVAWWGALSAAEHIAQESNRDGLNEAVAKTPLVISSPPAIAERANAPRNKLESQAKEYNQLAEKARMFRRLWRVILFGSTLMSAVSFVIGLAFPIYLIAAKISLGADDSMPTVIGTHPSPTKQ
jgi:hypothetical protein